MESTKPTSHENSLRQRVESGDLAASDELATLLYDRGVREEAATLYLKALQGGYYKFNQRPISERNFFGMIDAGLISSDSPASQYVRETRRKNQEVEGRAVSGAGKAGIATFIGYMAILFGGGVEGPLRDFSLIIASGLAWIVWKLVLSSFRD
jgi:hypothetical protein